ncbi:MAG: protein translocase subunit SecD [Clostridia bacterium]|nr:protein translocase subunit SecD [Clostridia bacterium]
MNYSRTTSAVWFVFAVLVIALLLTVSIAGLEVGDKEVIGGIFEEDTVRLGLDLAGGSSITYQAYTNDGSSVESSGMDDVLEVMRNRLDNAGYTEALAYRNGDDMIVIELPSIEDPTAAALDFMQTAKLEFRIHGQDSAVLTGEDVEKAEGGYRQDETTGEVKYAVFLEFNSAGATKFAEATKYCATNSVTLDILVDDVVISSPSVSSEYSSYGITGGKAEISGSFTTLEQAKALANNIDAGALRYNLKQVSMESVKASLGENALRISLIAGAIGLALVMVFMILYYKVAGLWASVSLVGYMAVFFLVLAIGKFNLTLTGIAGIVLSIGMAVDANVVIFERMKEEVRGGKTVKSAVKSGFKRALWAVLDSNVTTIIACVVLYIFGSGTIRGFALTLGIGVIISLISSLLVTRLFLNLGVNMGLSNTKLYKVGFGGERNA